MKKQSIIHLSFNTDINILTSLIHENHDFSRTTAKLTYPFAL